MNGLTGKAAHDAEGLRERNVSIQASDGDEARQAVLHLNALEERANKNEKDRKTFGRTPGGIGKKGSFRPAKENLLLRSEQYLHWHGALN